MQVYTEKQNKMIIFKTLKRLHLMRNIFYKELPESITAMLLFSICVIVGQKNILCWIENVPFNWIVSSVLCAFFFCIDG